MAPSLRATVTALRQLGVGLVAVLLLTALVVAGISTTINDWIADHWLLAGVIENAVVIVIVGLFAYISFLTWRRSQGWAAYAEGLDAANDGLLDGGPRQMDESMERLTRFTVRYARTSATSEPMLIVGDAGVGKSTLLASLVSALAEAGLLPVPLSARGAEELNLYDRARLEIVRTLEARLPPSQDPHLAARLLVSSRRMVVLVDSVEEFAPEALPQLRDRLLVRSFQEAQRMRLLVVAALRPATVPVGLRASRLEIPPMTPSAAATFLQSQLSLTGRLVRANAIGEMRAELRTPFYLRIIGLLLGRGLLDQEPGWQNWTPTQVVERYFHGLQDGTLFSEAAVGLRERMGAFSVLPSVATALAILPERAATPSRIADVLQSINHFLPAHRIDNAVNAAIALDLMQPLGSEGYIAFRHAILLAQFLKEALRATPELLSTLADHTLTLEVVNALESVAEVGVPTRSREVVLATADRLLGRLAGRPAARRSREAVLGTADRLLSRLAGPEVRLGDSLLALASRGSVSDGYRSVAGGLLCDLGQSLKREKLRSAGCALISRSQEGARRAERLAVVDALGRALSADAIPVLWKLTSADDYLVRWRAVEAFAKYPAALAAVRDEIETTVQIAERTDRIGIPYEGDLSLGVLGWYLPQVYAHAHGKEKTAAIELVARLLHLTSRIDPLMLEASLYRGIKACGRLGRLNELIAELGKGDLWPVLWHAQISFVHALARSGQSREKTLATISAYADRRLHPFVREGISVAHSAISIDEANAGIWENEVLELGSSLDQYSSRAARLLGDFSLMSNLVYLGRAFVARNDNPPPNYSQWARSIELPPCIRSFKVRRGLGRACPSHCQLGVCSFVAGRLPIAAHAAVFPSTRGAITVENAARAEFSEAFCRRQVEALEDLGTPPWVGPLQRRQAVQYWSSVQMPSGALDLASPLYR